jgi:hypothetical protein
MPPTRSTIVGTDDPIDHPTVERVDGEPSTLQKPASSGLRAGLANGGIAAAAIHTVV